MVLGCCGTMEYHVPFAAISETSSLMQPNTPRLSAELLEEPQSLRGGRKPGSGAAAVLRSVWAAVSFLPFLIALLIHLAATGKYVRPTRWQGYLHWCTWMVSVILSASFLSLPLVLCLLPHQLPVFIDVARLVAICYLPVLALHLLTIHYIFGLPHYTYPHAKPLPRWFSLRTAANVVHPIVEAAQLYALGLVVCDIQPRHPLEYAVLRLTCLGPLSWQQAAVVGGCVGLYGVLLGHLSTHPSPTSSSLAILGLQVLPGTLMVSVLEGLLAALAGAGGRPLPLVLAAQALMLYLATAPFVAAYKVPDGLHMASLCLLCTAPRFVALERALKGLLCVGLFVLRLRSPFSPQPQQRLLTGVVAALLLGVVWMRPSPSRALNWLRGYTLSTLLIHLSYAIAASRGAGQASYTMMAGFTVLYWGLYCLFCPSPVDQESTPGYFLSKPNVSDL